MDAAALKRSMLVFGGTDGQTELDDLWELTYPGTYDLSFE
jgi:hypothetical protein